MILSKFYDNLKDYEKERLAGGLVGGLVLGLVWGFILGLAGGLASGLVGGLVLGLVWGLTGGLVLGLAGGLVGGLVIILFNLSEALPFINGIISIIILAVIFLLFVELFFWLSPREKIKKKNIYWHTFKRKMEAVFEVLLLFSAVAQIYILTREAAKYFNKELLKFLILLVGYLGLAVFIILIVIGIFYLWIKLNSLKYRR